MFEEKKKYNSSNFVVVKKVKIKKRRLNRSLGGDICINLFLIIFGCFMALPMVYAICTSFKPADELWVYPPKFFVSSRF